MSTFDQRGRDVAPHRQRPRPGPTGSGNDPVSIMPPFMAACEQLMRKPAVADAIGIGVRTLERMVSAKEFPPPDIRCGPRLAMWRPSTVQGWIEDQARREQRGGAR